MLKFVAQTIFKKAEILLNLGPSAGWIRFIITTLYPLNFLNDSARLPLQVLSIRGGIHMFLEKKVRVFYRTVINLKAFLHQAWCPF